MRYQYQAGIQLGIKLEQLVEHPVGYTFVQVSGWLITQHQAWTANQCTGHGSTLAFTARQFTGLVIQTLVQAYFFKQVAGTFSRCNNRFATNQ